MIHALDHIAIAVASLQEASASYAKLLGRQADRIGARDACAWFQVANTGLKLAPVAPGTSTGLSELAFTVGDIAQARRLLERRGLVLPADEHAADTTTVMLPLETTYHVPIKLVEISANSAGRTPAPLAVTDASAAIAGIDHVVIRTPNPERAMLLYAARLGLDLRLDRSHQDWGMRLLFFRCGDLIIELAHDLKAGISDGPDELWGISWRAPDIIKAHARLRTAGIDVSDVRAGRRLETQVFTVRSGTVDVPTLVIGPSSG
jgi:catechol 2,3-dioxygenase-like lactoylglutathione lyase family enzyme